MNTIDISIAIVKNKEGHYLITRRADGNHQGGKWEFPGGKVERHETCEQTMLRELFEEVGLTPTSYTLFETVFFDYGDKQLNLYFYIVECFTGIAIAKEKQPLKWVDLVELKTYDFPAANTEVINKL